MQIQEKEVCAVSLVDKLLMDAIAKSASDIHFEPGADQLRIRMRIDGILHDQEPIDSVLMSQLLTRLKVLSNINIAQKRLPQDGKFQLKHNLHEVDLRVSTFPTYYGEKIVVRILDKSVHIKKIDSLGLCTSNQERLKSSIRKSTGFFLVCGPTGSGKTTTLYAALNEINDSQKNIITLEDPIEYFIPGVIQGQIHPDAGFTFEQGIRSVLRQDPDILMVGEIRDKQTARIAIEAALTGHLVFSTIHTNDSVSVVIRLMDMGIESFLVNAALTGIIAQRLARKLCVSCKTTRAITDSEATILEKLNSKIEVLYESKGCIECCGYGYKGRIGIFECLFMNNNLRSLINKYPSYDQIYLQALEQGMQPLVYDGLAKVEQGIISFSEMIRAIF